MLILANGTFNAGTFCGQEAVQNVFGLLGIVVTAIKVAIPIILIVFGMLDMGKAVTSGKDDEIKKQLMAFIRRAIAAVLVFFIPSIVGLILQTVNSAVTADDICGYDQCVQKVTGVSGKCSAK